MTMLDARPLTLVRRFVLPVKMRARSVYWHEVDSRPCTCETLHNHCRVVTCRCGRHEGEVGAP